MESLADAHLHRQQRCVQLGRVCAEGASSLPTRRENAIARKSLLQVNCVSGVSGAGRAYRLCGQYWPIRSVGSCAFGGDCSGFSSACVSLGKSSSGFYRCFV